VEGGGVVGCCNVVVVDQGERQPNVSPNLSTLTNRRGTICFLGARKITKMGKRNVFEG